MFHVINPFLNAQGLTQEMKRVPHDTTRLPLQIGIGSVVGANLYVTKSGSTAEYVHRIADATGCSALWRNPDPVASEEERNGFDYMDKDSIAPVLAVAEELGTTQPELAD